MPMVARASYWKFEESVGAIRSVFSSLLCSCSILGLSPASCRGCLLLSKRESGRVSLLAFSRALTHILKMSVALIPA